MQRYFKKEVNEEQRKKNKERGEKYKFKIEIHRGVYCNLYLHHK
jgi:hypothetical protein